MTTKDDLASSRMNLLVGDLVDSQLTRKQNFTDLTVHDGKKVKTYCALGAIGCEKGLIGFKVDSDNFPAFHRPSSYDIILNVYGLEDKLKHSIPISYYDEGKKKNGLVTTYENSLLSIIIELNDEGHLTFSEIGDFLRTLEWCNVLRPCSDTKMNRANEYLLKNIKEG